MVPEGDGHTAVFVAGKSEDSSVLTECISGKSVASFMAGNAGKESGSAGLWGQIDVENLSKKDAEKLTEYVQAEREKARKRLDRGWKAGTRFLVGNRAYMEENGITIDPMYVQGLDSIAQEGRTPLLVATEGELLGEIDVMDGIKSCSHAAIPKF